MWQVRRAAVQRYARCPDRRQLREARVAKLNTDEAQGTAARFNIRSIPTIALFRNGREVARQPGAMSAADIVRWVQSH